MSVVGAVEALVARLGVEAGAEPLAAVAVDLAERLDRGPADRTAVALSSELRQVLRQLAEQEPGGDSELDRWLAGLRDPTLRDGEV